MASSHLRGNATITYPPLAGGSVVHKLAVPLLISPASGFQATLRRRAWTAWSADHKTRETFTLGGAVDEIIGTVRFDNEPTQLRELMRSGLEDDVVLTYKPYGAAGDAFACKLVAIPGAAEGEIPLTPDRVGFAEYTVPLLLRRVDGNTWAALLDNTAAP